MTGSTLLGGRLVKEHLLRFDCLHQLMAAVTTYIAMHALQWEGGALVVVEESRFPLHTVVAIRARSDVIRATGELGAVNVLMAFFAFTWRGAEVGVRQLGAHVWRLVTVNACDRPVRAD